MDTISKSPVIEVVIGYLAKKPLKSGVDIDISDKSTYIHIEKETDVNLSNEMLEGAFYNQYQTALLFSADGDYSDTLKRLKKYKNLEVFVVIPEGSPSARVGSIVGTNHIINLSKSFLSVFILQPKE